MKEILSPSTLLRHSTPRQRAATASIAGALICLLALIVLDVSWAAAGPCQHTAADVGVTDLYAERSVESIVVGDAIASPAGFDQRRLIVALVLIAGFVIALKTAHDLRGEAR